MKKVFILTLVTLLLSSCSVKNEDTTIKNKSFINSFEKTNNALLEAKDQNIVGELSINASAAIEYKSSTIEAGVVSNNKQNIAYYDLTISPQTIVSILNQYTDIGRGADVLNLLPSYNNSANKVIIAGGNKTSKYLNFNSSSLENWYKTNKSYLSVDTNKIVLGDKLSTYDLETSIKDNNGKNSYVTSLQLSYDEIISLLPFLQTSSYTNDLKITLRAYHDEMDGVFNRIEIDIINYTAISENDLFIGKIDITLNFILPVGGAENETN